MRWMLLGLLLCVPAGARADCIPSPGKLCGVPGGTSDYPDCCPGLVCKRTYANRDDGRCVPDENATTTTTETTTTESTPTTTTPTTTRPSTTSTPTSSTTPPTEETTSSSTTSTTLPTGLVDPVIRLAYSAPASWVGIKATEEDGRNYPENPWLFTATDGLTPLQPQADHHSYAALRFTAQLIPLCRRLRGCDVDFIAKNAVSVVLGRLGIDEQYDHLGNFHDGRQMLGPGDWSAHNFYNTPWSAMKRVRTSALHDPETCAAYATQDNLDLLALVVEDGRCVKNDGAQQVALVPFDRSIARMATANGRVRFPVLDGRFLEALHETHRRHHEVTMAKVQFALWDAGGRVGPAPAIPVPAYVQDAHKAFGRLAPEFVDEHPELFDMNRAFLAKDPNLARTQMIALVSYFWQMKPFGGKDDAWSPWEDAGLNILTNRAHEDWMEAVAAGQWGLARRLDAEHFALHICEMVRDPNITFRPILAIGGLRRAIGGQDTNLACADYLAQETPYVQWVMDMVQQEARLVPLLPPPTRHATAARSRRAAPSKAWR